MLQPATAIFRDNRRIRIRQFALFLNHQSEFGHIIRYAGYLKVCARTVPRIFTVENQTEGKATSSVLLACFEAEGEAFLSRIVIVDDTWVHNFEPETKGQAV
jgi:hypothetical protein